MRGKEFVLKADTRGEIVSNANEGNGPVYEHLELWMSILFTQGVAHADEHFWSTLATIKYVGHGIEKNPVVLTRGPSQVGMTRRND